MALGRRRDGATRRRDGVGPIETQGMGLNKCTTPCVISGLGHGEGGGLDCIPLEPIGDHVLCIIGFGKYK